jgi:adenylate cyclase
VPELPGDIEGCRSDRIERGYLAVSAESEVRVRRIGAELVLTVKRGSGLERFEDEIEIAQEQSRALWRATEGHRLTKRRFYAPVGQWTAQVDVHGGDLDGLITAEVEFDSREESEAFDQPAWFGAEVTDDSRYANQALAQAAHPPDGG